VTNPLTVYLFGLLFVISDPAKVFAAINKNIFPFWGFYLSGGIKNSDSKDIYKYQNF
jgi:hypothetical protein